MIAVLPPDSLPPVSAEARGIFAELNRPLPAWYAELAQDAVTCPSDSHNGAHQRRDVGFGSSGRRRGYGAVSSDYKERPTSEQRAKHAWAGGDRPKSGLKQRKGKSEISMNYYNASQPEIIRSKKTVHAMKQPLPHFGKRQRAKLAKRGTNPQEKALT